MDDVRVQIPDRRGQAADRAHGETGGTTQLDHVLRMPEPFDEFAAVFQAAEVHVELLVPEPVRDVDHAVFQSARFEAVENMQYSQPFVRLHARVDIPR